MSRYYPRISLCLPGFPSSSFKTGFNLYYKFSMSKFVLFDRFTKFGTNLRKSRRGGSSCPISVFQENVLSFPGTIRLRKWESIGTKTGGGRTERCD